MLWCFLAQRWGNVIIIMIIINNTSACVDFRVFPKAGLNCRGAVLAMFSFEDC